MSRLIKFRAWCATSNRWLTHHEMSQYNFGEDVSLFRGVRFCQLTGLKDKNGKEIYEGDIVRWCGKNVLVEFEEGAFSYVCDMSEEEIKVIGNIYENQDIAKAIHEAQMKRRRK